MNNDIVIKSESVFLTAGSRYAYNDLRTTTITPGTFVRELFKELDQVLFIKNINKNRMYKTYSHTDDNNKDVYLYIEQNNLYTAINANAMFTRNGRFKEILLGNKPITDYDEAYTKVITFKLGNENVKHTVPLGYKDVLIKKENKIYLVTKEQFDSLLEAFSVLNISDGYWIELRDVKEDLIEDNLKGYEANQNAINGMKNIHLIGTEQERHTPEYYLEEESEYVDVDILDEDEYKEEQLEKQRLAEVRLQTGYSVRKNMF